MSYEWKKIHLSVFNEYFTYNRLNNKNKELTKSLTSWVYSGFNVITNHVIIIIDLSKLIVLSKCNPYRERFIFATPSISLL